MDESVFFGGLFVVMIVFVTMIVGYNWGEDAGELKAFKQCYSRDGGTK